jgi:hypothetical protein
MEPRRVAKKALRPARGAAIMDQCGYRVQKGPTFVLDDRGLPAETVLSPHFFNLSKTKATKTALRVFSPCV